MDGSLAMHCMIGCLSWFFMHGSITYGCTVVVAHGLSFRLHRACGADKNQTHTDPSKYRQEDVTQGKSGKPAAGAENKKTNTHTQTQAITGKRA